MNCEYCGAELKQNANFCTICGMPVSGPAAEPEEKPVPVQTNYRTGPDTALKGYTSYTSGEYRTDPRAEASSIPSAPTEEGPVWAAWVALILSVLSLKGALLVVPGILLGVGGIIVGAIGCKSELRTLSICDIVIGALGVLLSIAMILVWSGVFGLAYSFMGEIHNLF